MISSLFTLKAMWPTIFPSTLKFVKNTPLHVIFLTLFLVFRNVVKHGLSCLIFYITSQTHQWFITLKQKKNSQPWTMPWRRFGYLVLISIDFDDFTSPFTPFFLLRLRRYIKHSRQCFIHYPNTSNFVKNTLLHIMFSTLFLVFGYPDETLSLVFDIFTSNSLSGLCVFLH